MFLPEAKDNQIFTPEGVSNSHWHNYSVPGITLCETLDSNFWEPLPTEKRYIISIAEAMKKGEYSQLKKDIFFVAHSVIQIHKW